jgi:ABC-type nickel/cobalt efflux system permease component RcnA
MSHGHHHHGDEQNHGHPHNHDRPDHSHDHGHANSGERKWHRDWRVWVGAILMIGILIYCLATFIL